MRADKKSHLKPEKKTAPRSPKRVHMGYSKKTALLEEAITQMNAGKYGRSSAALKELLNLDPHNMEARRLFATLHLRLGSLIPARQAFDSLINEAVERQDYWLAESLLREYLAAGPRCVPFLEKLGGVFEEKGDALEAATEYGKAIDILLEDPDSDNPQRPSQLYAKIRELAPASPVAFRLASFFNAQTGELIGCPPLSPTEVPVFNKPVDAAPAQAVPSNEVMPWDNIDDLPEPAPVSRTSAVPPPTIPPESSLGSEPAVIGGPTERAAEEARVSRGDTAVSEGQLPITHAEPIDVPLRSTSDVDHASVGEPHATTEEDSARQPQPSQRQVSRLDPAPAPMPWDQVQDTTIHIVETGPEPAPLPAQSFVDPEASVPEPQQPAELESAPAPMPWDQVEDTTIHIVETGPEPAPLPAQSFVDPEASVPEPQQPPGLGSVPAPMPWDQVQDTTIHIDDPVSEPEVLPAQFVAGFEASVPEPQQPAELESVPAPMPWDQVQDTTIHIDDPVSELEVLPVQPFSDPEASVLLNHQQESAVESPSLPLALEPVLEAPVYSDDPVLDPGQSLAGSSVPEHQRRAATESMHAPLPWDQGQDASIPIADPVEEPDVLQAESSAEPESLGLALQQPTAMEPVSIPSPEERVQEARIPAPQAVGAEETAAPTATDSPAIQIEERPGEPAGLESGQDKFADARTDPRKRGGFSWQSISRAWKFGKHAPAEEPREEAMQPLPPLSHEESGHAAESGLQPAEAALQGHLEPAASSAGRIEIVAVDLPQTDGGIAVSPGNHPAQSSVEGMASAHSQESVHDTSPLQASGEKTETAPDVDVVAEVPATEYEFRLQRIEQTPGQSTDTTAVTESSGALDHSPLEVIGDTRGPERSEPVHRAASDMQQDAVLSALTGEASTADVWTPPLSVAIEPIVDAEERTIQPLLAPEQPGTLTGIAGEATAQAPVAESSPVPMQEAGARSTLDAPSVEQQVHVDSSLDLPTESPQVPPALIGDVSHWHTGEVAVQVHRPTSNKRQNTGPPVVQRFEDPNLKSIDQPVSAAGESTGAPIAEPLEDQDEWIKTGAAIRFTEPLAPALAPFVPAGVPEEAPKEERVSSAAAAVDYLFATSGSGSTAASTEHTAYSKQGRRRLRAKLARVQFGLSVLIGSCFSTTRAMVISALAFGCFVGTLTAIGLGAVALTWMVMEESPSSAFRHFTTTPLRTLSDTKQNGYVFLLGFDAPAGQDVFQLGQQKQGQGKDAGLVAACLGGPDHDGRGGQTQGSAYVANELFRARDPVGAIRSRRDTVKAWVGKNERALARYTQWLELPFEDWGYGESVNPPCRSIAFAHQLYVAEGVVLGTEAGMARLEADMEAWRTVLAQARTLPLKTVALQAVQDDAAVVSGFILDPGFDVKMMGRLTKMVRPLDPAEQSLRWPMQSELVWASRHVDAQLKAERAEDLPLYAATAAMLPLPKQRRLNQYAEYFEASSKAGDDLYGVMPKRDQYIHVPAGNVIDYFRDPLENLIGLEPLPEWNRYTARVGDLDARLRLVRLQGWLRRGPQDADLAGRIAKAGQDFYDPYTGFPMLVNRKKAALYSVGHDGRDQDADAQTDIVVGIPVSPAPAVSVESDAGSAAPR